MINDKILAIRIPGGTIGGVWFDESKAFMIYTIKNPKSDVSGISHGNTELMEEWNCAMWEIIGNEFDNPELIGE